MYQVPIHQRPSAHNVQSDTARLSEPGLCRLIGNMRTPRATVVNRFPRASGYVEIVRIHNLRSMPAVVNEIVHFATVFDGLAAHKLNGYSRLVV